MKIKDLLEIQSIIEKRKTPCDMNGDLNQHYSTSKDEHINILDMDLIHLVRSYSKCLSRDGGMVEEKSQEILDNLDVIENRLFSVKELFKCL
jgi:DNA gyrase/topoisomerase IV subunit A